MEEDKKPKEKDQPKERKNPLEGKKATVLKPGDNQKTVLLITDGRKVDVQASNVNLLEVEMMLTKALDLIKSQNN